MNRSKRVAALVAVAMLCACGGSQDTESTEANEAATTAPEETTPEPVAEQEPEEDPRQDLLWYVFWDGIHVMTVYPMPGPIRSEEPENANAVFSSDNDNFSLISHYYEQEDFFADTIAAATSLDDLLERLAAIELVEIQEDINPVRQIQ